MTILFLGIEMLNAQKLKSWSVKDGGDEKKAYLAKEVTIEGENLDRIDALSVGGIEAKIAKKSDTQIKFAIPETFKFNAAKECEVVAKSGKNNISLLKVTVYPFYFYPDVRLGAQGKNNRDVTFFQLNSGEVLSSDEWNDALAGSETQSAASVLNKDVVASEVDYLSVEPYFFLMSSYKTQGLSFVSPSNSKRMLGNIQKTDNTSIVSGDTWGTPIVGFRQLSYPKSTKYEKAYTDSVSRGTLRTISPKTILTRGTCAYPTFTTEESTQTNFKTGQVMLVNHITYGAGKLQDVPASGIERMGYLYIKDISDIDPATGLPTVDSRVTFDMYWSRPIQ